MIGAWLTDASVRVVLDRQDRARAELDVSNPSGDSAKTTPLVFGGERSVDERIYRLPSATWIVRRKELLDGLAVLVTWHELQESRCFLRESVRWLAQGHRCGT